jgi:hypothetical protein
LIIAAVGFGCVRKNKVPLGRGRAGEELSMMPMFRNKITYVSCVILKKMILDVMVKKEAHTTHPQHKIIIRGHLFLKDIVSRLLFCL